jgi:hypothetical protein
MARMAKKGNSTGYPLHRPRYDTPEYEELENPMYRFSEEEKMCIIKNPKLRKRMMLLKARASAEVAKKLRAYARKG